MGIYFNKKDHHVTLDNVMFRYENDDVSIGWLKDFRKIKKLKIKLRSK